MCIQNLYVPVGLLEVGVPSDLVCSFVDNLQKRRAACIVKIISLRQFQIAQTRAQTPILICALDALSIPFNHLPNMFLILAGAAY
jgi:hypothetical protein